MELEDSLLAVLPVILMVIFLLMYFCRYANTLEKCFNLKKNCFRRINGNSRDSCQRYSRRNFTSDPAEGPIILPADHDEALILLKSQVTRMVLAESEAMRLAKRLFVDNDYAARECIANIRSTLFPNFSVNSTHEYEINPYSREQTIRRESVLPNPEISQKGMEQPPSYEDCV